MTVETAVEVRGDQTVVVKRSGGGQAQIDRLRREGERLRLASHPGVVSVLRSAPAGSSGWELVTLHEGRPLSTIRGLTASQVAGVFASVASTLADLHAIGICHGRIDGSHVLVTDGGRAVLCGLGGGERPASAEDDVAELGALLASMLGEDGEPEPIPERRWRRGRRWQGWERRALLLLADQASADDPQRRPSARRLAAAIAEAVPSHVASPAHTDVTDAVDPLGRLRPKDDDLGSRSPQRRVGLVLLAAGAAVVVFALMAKNRPGPTSPQVAARPAVESPALRTARPVAGSVVTADGKRYRVGQPGDHLLVDDWACNGRPTMAAFRPSTHEVFVFDRWATRDSLSVVAAAKVPHSVAMVSVLGEDGCPALSLRTAEGGTVPVALEDPQ